MGRGLCTAFRATNGAASKSRMTRAGPFSIRPPGSECRVPRRYRPRATIWHFVSPALRVHHWSSPACVSTRNRRTSTSSSIAIRQPATSGSSGAARAMGSSMAQRWESWLHAWFSRERRQMSSSSSPALLDKDFERFKRELPRDVPAHVRDTYRIDLSARYLGQPLPHPIGKGSGQLSLNSGQLETDAEAGLAFAVLKTVIAQDAAGDQSMAAWAIHETKMKVERRDAGWTVTWKGRGWDRSFDDYLSLVRAGRDLTRAGRLLAVPSVKYHLPRLSEPFRDAEYAYTTRALVAASCVSSISHRERSDERRSEEHTSELQSRSDLVCRLLLEKKKTENKCAEESKPNTHIPATNNLILAVHSERATPAYAAQQSDQPHPACSSLEHTPLRQHRT